jgi:hypothetical protein
MKRVRLIIPTERCAQVSDDGASCSNYCVHLVNDAKSPNAKCTLRGYPEPVVDGNRTALCLASEQPS